MILIHSRILLLVVCNVVLSSESPTTCTTNEECVLLFREGASCENNLCVNPFYNGGCLKNLLPDWHRTRVCGSDDPPEALEKGYCQAPTLDYTEVRIGVQNWEAAFMAAWMLQIILNEMLGIPVSLELGAPGLTGDLYDKHARTDRGLSTYYPELRTGYEAVDCKAVRTNDPETYKGCVHVVAEIWPNNFIQYIKELEESGAIYPPYSQATIGKIEIFIPARTAKQHPDYLSYFGLAGEDKRRELAGIFKPPTTWGDYCAEVSLTNCSVPDAVALRAPNVDEEGDYFSEGDFTGHFRDTELNNCDINPDCRGIFLAFPCDWNNHMYQKLFWTNIQLEVVTFTYNELNQIVNAANATKADIIHMWWTPEPLYELYFGTDSQLAPVMLPPPTEECLEYHNTLEFACSTDPDELAGDKRGACEDDIQQVQKIIGSAVSKFVENQGPGALYNPVLEAASRLEITSLNYNTLYELWKQKGRRWGFDVRDATCQWVAENLEVFQAKLPPQFPREVDDKSSNSKTTQVLGFAFFAGVSITLLMSAILGWDKRLTKRMYHTQLFFFYTVHLGLGLVLFGALLKALNPTNAICSSRSFLIDLGYSIILTPIVWKCSLVAGEMGRDNHMHRIRLDFPSTIKKIAYVAGTVLLFQLAWVIFDARQETKDFVLTDYVNEYGETMVQINNHCRSRSGVWEYVSFGWKLGALLYGLGLVSLASQVGEDVNGVRNLGAILLANLVVLVFRFTFHTLGESVGRHNTDNLESIFLSIDCFLTLAVFSGPLLFTQSDEAETDDMLPDLFTETTIVMADVVGFTKWSSMREPVQVFKLLEELFCEFDAIAERRKVFKVESVGDCYVAAAGIPNARRDHAIAIARFSLDCMKRLHAMLHRLEIAFGPDTADLNLRIGIHSGAVTGGFLKGRSSRFQLFGDVVNVVGRMESSGAAGRIHISGATAELLEVGGKGHWVVQRSEKIFAKGKGELQTYWLVESIAKDDLSDGGSSRLESCSHNDALLNSDLDERDARLVHWNAQVLIGSLQEIVKNRPNNACRMNSHVSSTSPQPAMPLDEVQEIIFLPKFNIKAANATKSQLDSPVSEKVKQQLVSLVATIGAMYRNNEFHNFQHASHVVMSVTKYLHRINTPVELELGKKVKLLSTKDKEAIHEHTYGIASDPLTHFACCFSALIHDLDHPGVPNPRFMEENPMLREMYKGRSVAEQNSFDLAWGIFMEDRFDELRSAICPNEFELQRFRQLIINSVMATDLGDKELKELRNDRWKKAFSAPSDASESLEDASNRKATIVIEHVIQAADVSHTMQHWHVYRQWNENLFRELYMAFRDGRIATNPAESWYEGEIGFFDFYVIPLSEKLRDCGVFGVSSDENLSYARANRSEWVARGREVVAEMVHKLEGAEVVKATEKHEEEKFPDGRAEL